MPVSRGDIIPVDLPFSDLTGHKTRPALVVQNDANNQKLDDVIIAIVTRSTHRAKIEATQMLVDITMQVGRQTGLLYASAIKCEHLITVHQRLIQRVIGKLPPQLMRKVDECLKVSLEL